MASVYLLIGGNLGNRIKLLEEAREMIARSTGTITRISSIYETEPWGFIHKRYFLNQCLKVKTSLPPYDILKSIKNIEVHFDRRKNSGTYKSRRMDIDILFYDNIILHEEDLQIPHPLLQERRFVLVPLVEIQPDFIHPVLNKSVRELLSQCSDNKIVKLYEV
ncbi:MAG: hypothetical protein AMS27_00265 [Bacteroides sp. SM23_62_1]|nr:MAG: hypothetical protein AMS27_00265 [Bacteroides sp. SM23_62_1]